MEAPASMEWAAESYDWEVLSKGSEHHHRISQNLRIIIHSDRAPLTMK